MRVFYDGQAFDMQTHGGVSRYITEIYKNKRGDVEATLGVVESDNVYLRQFGIPTQGFTYHQFISNKEFPLKRFLYKAYYNCKYGHADRWDHTPKLNQLFSESIIRKGDFDCFHASYFDGYFLDALGERPFILTVHDMISELYPQFYEDSHPLVTGKKLLIPIAAHIIAISQRTKEDLMKLMHVPEEKITVIYHGVDVSPFTPSTHRICQEDYILYVGERHFYKNFDLFFREVLPLLKRHKELKVVCTGKPFEDTEQKLIEEKGMVGRFIHTFTETEQELMDLYHNALCFVYPSAYEGFGMPILEAYKADCPVMLSNASCFPEIAGDAAVYFNIDKEKSDFAEQFETLYHLDSNERELLLSKQRERLRLYSWKKSASEHAAVYQRFC